MLRSLPLDPGTVPAFGQTAGVTPFWRSGARPPAGSSLSTAAAAAVGYPADKRCDTLLDCRYFFLSYGSDLIGDQTLDLSRSNPPDSIRSLTDSKSCLASSTSRCGVHISLSGLLPGII